MLDADLTGPMVARLLGLRPQVGLEDLIEDGKALADALIDAPDDHLCILPMRTAVARPREFLASPAWTCTLARLRREFDLILVDGGPLFTGLSAASPPLSRRRGSGSTPRHDRRAQQSSAPAKFSSAGGIPLLGSAETFV